MSVEIVVERRYTAAELRARSRRSGRIWYFCAALSLGIAVWQFSTPQWAGGLAFVALTIFELLAPYVMRLVRQTGEAIGELTVYEQLAEIREVLLYKRDEAEGEGVNGYSNDDV